MIIWLCLLGCGISSKSSKSLSQLPFVPIVTIKWSLEPIVMEESVPLLVLVEIAEELYSLAH